MKVRADIAELLRAGWSDRAVAEHAHCAKTTAAAARAALGLPKTKPGRAPISLRDAFYARTRPVDGGHREWTGPLSHGTPRFWHDGQSYTARQAAYLLAHGRRATGKALPGCGHDDCVEPAHQDDARDRARLHHLATAIFGGAA
ncbi:hypothetical protein [Streptomyces chumphonensis]|uniref:hypothetical protein n=1 Tax=Streptomyces chumphonensis TaxID=1214925 RepID=UPI003D75457D